MVQNEVSNIAQEGAPGGWGVTEGGSGSGNSNVKEPVKPIKYGGTGGGTYSDASGKPISYEQAQAQGTIDAPGEAAMKGASIGMSPNEQVQFAKANPAEASALLMAQKYGIGTSALEKAPVVGVGEKPPTQSVFDYTGLTVGAGGAVSRNLPQSISEFESQRKKLEDIEKQYVKDEKFQGTEAEYALYTKQHGETSKLGENIKSQIDKLSTTGKTSVFFPPLSDEQLKYDITSKEFVKHLEPQYGSPAYVARRYEDTSLLGLVNVPYSGYIFGNIADIGEKAQTLEYNILARTLGTVKPVEHFYDVETQGVALTDTSKISKETFGETGGALFESMGDSIARYLRERPAEFIYKVAETAATVELAGAAALRAGKYFPSTVKVIESGIAKGFTPQEVAGGAMLGLYGASKGYEIGADVFTPMGFDMYGKPIKPTTEVIGSRLGTTAVTTFPELVGFGATMFRPSRVEIDGAKIIAEAKVTGGTTPTGKTLIKPVFESSKFGGKVTPTQEARLTKLWELSTKGTGGEKITAESKLKTQMEEFNVRIKKGTGIIKPSKTYGLEDILKSESGELFPSRPRQRTGESVIDVDAALARGNKLRQTFTGSLESFGSKGYKPTGEIKTQSSLVPIKPSKSYIRTSMVSLAERPQTLESLKDLTTKQETSLTLREDTSIKPRDLSEDLVKYETGKLEPVRTGKITKFETGKLESYFKGGKLTEVKTGEISKYEKPGELTKYEPGKLEKFERGEITEVKVRTTTQAPWEFKIPKVPIVIPTGRGSKDEGAGGGQLGGRGRRGASSTEIRNPIRDVTWGDISKIAFGESKKAAQMVSTKPVKQVQKLQTKQPQVKAPDLKISFGEKPQKQQKTQTKQIPKRGKQQKAFWEA